MNTPKVSVVVASGAGGKFLFRCLASLSRQIERAGAELIVVDRMGDATRARIVREFQGARLIAAPSDHRAVVPEMRRIGVDAARGEIVAILEEHCTAPPRWLEGIVSSFRPDDAAIGGPILDSAFERLRDWCVFFSEYHNFMPPWPDGERYLLNGANIAYSRSKLARYRAVLDTGYWEVVLHPRLVGDGKFRGVNALGAHHTGPFEYRYYLRQRYLLSRAWGGTQKDLVPFPKRVMHLLVGSDLPLVPVCASHGACPGPEAVPRQVRRDAAAARAGVDRLRVGRMARLSVRPGHGSGGSRMTTVRRMSVVVGLISGKKSDLQRCLRALHRQTLALPLEILVPYDDPCADVATLASEFAGVKFIRAEGLDTWKARAGASREHHDTLRTIGIRAATGDVIALTEDHAHMAETWCEKMIAALGRLPEAAAIGGALDCDSDRLLNWAVWFCDFGRYQNPLPEHRSEFVSDSNVAYRRLALEKVRSTWQHNYHETAVHWAMVAAGFELCTTPRVVVWQARSGLTLGAALRERYVWARSFAGTRARLIGAKRFVLAAISPLLPVVMTWRLAKIALQRGRHKSQFVRVLPLIVLLQTIWGFGEFVGYVTSDPG